MNALWIVICSTALSTCPATAQNAAPQAAPAQPQSAPAGSTTTIASGSVIPVSLTKTVDAKKAKGGDEVQAKVTADIKTNSGEVLLPKDSKIIGHITSAQAHSKEQKQSQLTILFDQAATKNGTQMQMPMSIQAIIAPPDSSPGNAQPSGVSGGVSPVGMPAGSSSGRSPGMGGSAPSSPNIPASDSSTTASNGSARPPITGETKGVIGIADLTLAPASDASQGSVLTSEKNNVKIESGTLMLLRVN